MFQKSEQGAVAVTVALTLIVLVGMTALALDGGFAYNERRATQNAADHAALAAAYAKCDGASDLAAVQAGIDSALLNGFDGDASHVGVNITKVASPTSGLGGTYEVVITTDIDNQLGGAVGAPQTTVLSEAVATCSQSPWLNGYAIFANAPPSCSGSVELNFTGSSKTVNGGVHSNGDLNIQGATTIINGPVTYSGSANVAAGTFPPGYPQSLSQQGLPSGISDLNVANLQAEHGADFHTVVGDITNRTFFQHNPWGTGSMGSINITQGGVFYTTGSIHLQSVTTSGDALTRGVTLVSEGGIHITGTGTMNNFDDRWDLLMMSNHPGTPICGGSDVAIQWSASASNWNGLIYAPNGQARQNNASSGATIHGSIVAHTVSLNGSSFNINYQDNAEHEPDLVIQMDS